MYLIKNQLDTKRQKKKKKKEKDKQIKRKNKKDKVWKNILTCKLSFLFP